MYFELKENQKAIDNLALDIFWVLSDMDNTQIYSSIDEITEQLKSEKGRAYLIESLFELSLNGDNEAKRLIYEILHKVQGANNGK